MSKASQMQGTEPASFEAGILSCTPAHKKYQGDTCPLRDEEKLIRLASQNSQLLRLVKQQSARAGRWVVGVALRSTEYVSAKSETWHWPGLSSPPVRECGPRRKTLAASRCYRSCPWNGAAEEGSDVASLLIDSAMIRKGCLENEIAPPIRSSHGSLVRDASFDCRRVGVLSSWIDNG